MSDCNHDVKQKMCQMGKCKPTPGALTREQVEDHCNMLADANVDWPGRESLSEALLDHDAALRATITQQAQELERVKERLHRYNHWTPEHTIEEWLADRQRIVDAKQVEADAQLQATLAAREARIQDLQRGLAAILQALFRY